MKKNIIYIFICIMTMFIFSDLVFADDTELNITMLHFPSSTDEDSDAYKNAGGDAVLLESKGEYLLMDTFNNVSIYDIHPIVQYLKDNNVNKLSIYLSHFHADHYGGLKNLLLADGITVERVYLPRTEYFCKYYDVDKKFSSNYFYKRYKDLNNVENPETGYTYRFYEISRQEIPITYLWPDTNAVYTEESNGYKNCFGLVEKDYSNKITFGDTTIDIIGPKDNLDLDDIEIEGVKLSDYKTPTGKAIYEFAKAENAQDGTSLSKLQTEDGKVMNLDTLGQYGNIYINSYSLVAMVRVGNTKYFTAGDINNYQEAELLNSGIDLKADIMKASHHVNAGSNQKEFIKKVSPKYMFAQNSSVKNPDALLFDSNGNLKEGEYYNSLKYMIYGDEDTCTNNCFSGANMYFEQFNGFTRFNIKNDIITVYPDDYELPLDFYSSSYTFLKNGALTLKDNIKTVTINYVDKDTNEILSDRVFRFPRAVTYHLYDYIANIDGYELVSADGVNITGKIMKNDDNITYNIYYQKKTEVKNDVDTNTTKNEEKTEVEVANTLKIVSNTLFIISVALIIGGCCFIGYYYISTKKDDNK